MGVICDLRGQKKALKIQKSKKIYCFPFSKYDISRTVALILMIFFANCWQFNSLSRLKKKSFKNIQNFEKKIQNFLSLPENDNVAVLQVFDGMKKKIEAWLGIGNPKLIKVGLVLDKIYFCCWSVLKIFDKVRFKITNTCFLIDILIIIF